MKNRLASGCDRSRSTLGVLAVGQLPRTPWASHQRACKVACENEIRSKWVQAQVELFAGVVDKSAPHKPKQITSVRRVQTG